MPSSYWRAFRNPPTSPTSNSLRPRRKSRRRRTAAWVLSISAMQDFDNAVKELQLATMNPSPDATDLYVLGVSLQQLKRNSEAAEALTNAPKSPAPCRIAASNRPAKRRTRNNLGKFSHDGGRTRPAGRRLGPPFPACGESGAGAYAPLPPAERCQCRQRAPGIFGRPRARFGRERALVSVLPRLGCRAAFQGTRAPGERLIDSCGRETSESRRPSSAGSGRRKNRGPRKKRLLADAYEAIVGAIYRDAGLPGCGRFSSPHADRSGPRARLPAGWSARTTNQLFKNGSSSVPWAPPNTASIGNPVRITRRFLRSKCGTGAEGFLPRRASARRRRSNRRQDRPWKFSNRPLASSDDPTGSWRINGTGNSAPAANRCPSRKSAIPRMGGLLISSIRCLSPFCLRFLERLSSSRLSRFPSESMEPTLLVGDHLLVNKFVFEGPGRVVRATCFPTGRSVAVTLSFSNFPLTTILIM